VLSSGRFLTCCWFSVCIGPLLRAGLHPVLGCYPFVLTLSCESLSVVVAFCPCSVVIWSGRYPFSSLPFLSRLVSLSSVSPCLVFFCFLFFPLCAPFLPLRLVCFRPTALLSLFLIFHGPLSFPTALALSSCLCRPLCLHLCHCSLSGAQPLLLRFGLLRTCASFFVLPLSLMWLPPFSSGGFLVSTSSLASCSYVSSLVLDHALLAVLAVPSFLFSFSSSAFLLLSSSSSFSFSSRRGLKNEAPLLCITLLPISSCHSPSLYSPFFFAQVLSFSPLTFIFHLPQVLLYLPHVCIFIPQLFPLAFLTLFSIRPHNQKMWTAKKTFCQSYHFPLF